MESVRDIAKGFGFGLAAAVVLIGVYFWVSHRLEIGRQQALFEAQVQTCVIALGHLGDSHCRERIAKHPDLFREMAQEVMKLQRNGGKI